MNHAIPLLLPEKMRSGQALTDEDRWPWLQTLAGVLEEHCSHEKQCVMACSCLKRRYRQVLSGEEKEAPHTDEIAFVSAAAPGELWGASDASSMSAVRL